MIINFMKMHGLGNDFIVIDGISQRFNIVKSQIIKLANRNLGVGCDQLLIIEPPLQPHADLYYRIFNQDGNEAMQCGNGARCIAKYAFDAGLARGTKLMAECRSGISEIEFIENDEYRVNLCDIPKTINKLNGSSFPEIKSLHHLNIGNDHIVCVVDNLKKINIYRLSKKIMREYEQLSANINFMEITALDTMKLTVFERGVGLTLACGSGACASTMVAHSLGLVNPSCQVKFKHGSLMIELNTMQGRIYMTGPAKNVFLGQFKV
jgi:diaminopimelate epimerase